MDKKTISLALAFSAILHEWLTPEQMQEVLRRNKTPQYINNGSCATHDFCDANQAMIDAYKALGHVTPLTPEDDDPEYQMKMDQIEKDINEVSKMWAFARKHDFFTYLYAPKLFVEVIIDEAIVTQCLSNIPGIKTVVVDYDDNADEQVCISELDVDHTDNLLKDYEKPTSTETKYERANRMKVRRTLKELGY